jgi:excisionase family DNA binding protein
MHDAQHDGSLTIAEAASQLGISSDTVRRRIRRGELAAVQVHTPNGPAWRVTLGALHSASSTLGSNAHSAVQTLHGALCAAPSRPSDAEAGYLADLVRQLAERAEANAAAAAMWQARAEHQAERDQALEQLRALPAPEGSEIAPQRDSAQRANEAGQTSAQPARRAWWAFWHNAPAA